MCRFNRPKYRFYAFTLTLIFLLSGTISQAGEPETITIGVLAFRSQEMTLARWAPTADYLTASIGGYRFQIRAMNFPQLEQAVKENSVDFVLTNSGHYVKMEALHGISRMATLVKSVGQMPFRTFGGVIFTRSERDDIKTVEDIRGKHFLAVNENSLGGYMLGLYTLLEHGVDRSNFGQLSFTGMPHDKVVYQVLSGGADVGTVRTSVLEQLVQEGSIKETDFKIFHREVDPEFPYVRSTQLFPEWPFAKMPQTSDALANRVTIALLQVPESHPAAKAGQYAGWSVPLDYQPVHQVMKRLQLPPYERLGKVTIGQVISQYLEYIALFLVLALLASGYISWKMKHANQTMRVEILRRKKAEQSLIQSAQRLTLTLVSIGDGVIVTDSGGRVSLMNPIAENLTKWAREEAEGKSLNEVFHIFDAESRERIFDLLVDIEAEDRAVSQPKKTLLIAKDGAEYRIANNVAPIRDEAGQLLLGAIIVFRDVTKEYQLQNELMEQQHFFADTLDNLKTFIAVLENSGAVRFINSPLLEEAGVKEKDVLGKKVYDLPLLGIFDAEKKILQADIERCSKGDYFVNNRELIANKGKSWLEYSIHPVFSEQGEVNALIVEARDDTSRKLAEESVAASERHYRALIEATGTGYIVLNEQGNITDANQEFLLLSGHDSLDEILGHSPNEWIVDSDQKSNAGLITYLEKTGNVRDQELDIIGANGQTVPVSINATRIESTGGTQYLALVHDISELKQKEAILRRTQKMEAVGKLTGGIAHDFNNQLGVVLGYLDFLGDYLIDDEKAKHWLEIITKATQRSIDLTRQLLVFSRHQQIKVECLDINNILEEMRELIGRSLTPEVEVRYQLGNEIWPIAVNHGELEDALLNLIINARDAMPRGGTLTIATRNRYLDRSFSHLPPKCKPGDYLQIDVTDTGTGISQEAQDQVFEPFFSTKEEGKGTGLGLAMVYSFVNRGGGFITLYSEPNHGTTFHIFLPRHLEHEVEVSQQGEEQIERAVTSASRGEIVLVVEDESQLRDLALNYLEMLGYQTIEAANAADALIVLEGDSEIDVLFSDVIMPGGMNGYELAEQAAKLRPELKIMLTSGFTGHGTLTPEQQRFSENLLGKPYTRAELTEHMHKLLAPEQSEKQLTEHREPSTPTDDAWCEKMATGVDILDQEHKQLLEVLTQYRQAITDGTIGEKAGQLLEAILSFSVTHFKHEERMMQACHYPYNMNHHEVHQMITQNLMRLKRDFQRSPDTFNHKATIELLQQWLEDHIIDMDASYVPYIKGHEEKIIALLAEREEIDD